MEVHNFLKYASFDGLTAGKQGVMLLHMGQGL
jgi:hypothetical protein